MAMEGSSDDFAISVAAYWNFVEANGLQKKIDRGGARRVQASHGPEFARFLVRSGIDSKIGHARRLYPRHAAHPGRGRSGRRERLVMKLMTGSTANW
jgi:hypothetical protein